MELIKYAESISNRINTVELTSPNISSYEEWTNIINRELGLDLTIDEVVGYFVVERELEDNYLTLRHCGRW